MPKTTYKYRVQIPNMKIRHSEHNLFEYNKRLAYMRAVEELYDKGVNAFNAEYRVMNTSGCWPDVPTGMDETWEDYFSWTERDISLVEWVFKYETEKQ